MVSVGIGVFAFIVFNDGSAQGGVSWGGAFGFFSSFIAVPAGALLGFIRAQVAKGNAVEYVIGDGEWVIVK